MAEHDHSDRSPGAADDAPTRNTKPWDPEAAIHALKDEADVFDHTPESLGKKLLTEAVPPAVASLTHLALNAQNENVRLKASQYLIDRAYGPPTKSEGGEDSALTDFLQRLEVEANKGQG